jgi:cytochrome c-type biogenesis protein CcmH
MSAAIIAPLPDPVDEARARALEQELRCVACENEPISQSGADIAFDMRRELRAQIAEGRSDDEVRQWFRERYGDFVLLRPPFDARTWALWGAPLALAAAALAGLIAIRRRRERNAPEAASALEPEETER